MDGYEIAHLEEIAELEDGREPMRPVRHHFGITGFGVNAWTGHEAGDRILNEHSENEPDADEELYVVISGRAVFELDGERKDAPAGTFVFVRPGVKRTAFADEAGTTIVAIGGTPGSRQPIGWELWAPLRPLYEAGDYATVVARGRELVETSPQYGLLFYNLGCCECLVGDTAEALEHVRRSIELAPQLREYAREDSDLDAIRADPSFQALLAG